MEDYGRRGYGRRSTPMLLEHVNEERSEAAADALTKGTSRVLRVVARVPLRVGRDPHLEGEAPLILVDSIGGFFWREVKPAEDQCAAPSLFQACVRAVGWALIETKSYHCVRQAQVLPGECDRRSPRVPARASGRSS